MVKFRGSIFVAVSITLLAQGASAGKLKDFSTKATSNTAEPTDPVPAPAQPQTYDSAATSSFGSGTYPSSGGGDSFLGGFFAWLVTAPFEYQYDDPAAGSVADNDEEWASERQRIFPIHELGLATVPYVRLDYNWHYVDSNIDAKDVRLEAGYKAVALHVRTSRFSDQSDGYELDINQYYGVVRYGGFRPDFIPGTFEAGLGLGVCEFKDNEQLADDSGGAITIPLKYYPRDWYGFEFRPAWYRLVEKVIGDYDISASLGRRYVQLRGGYRWMWIQGEGKFNNGPYAGVSVSF
ncbi:MAG: hypothetical protein V3V05_06040 [Pontiella sp.]